MDVVDGKIVSAGSDRSSETWSTSTTSAATATTSNSSSTCDPSICELPEESLIATAEAAASCNYITSSSSTPAPPGWATSSWRMTPTAARQVSSCGEYYFNNHPGSPSMSPTGLSNCKMQVAGRHLPPASGMISMNVPSMALLDVSNPSDHHRWGVVATPAGTFFVEEGPTAAAGGGAGAGAGAGYEFHSNTHPSYNNNFFQSAGGAQHHHQRLNPNHFLPPPPPPPPPPNPLPFPLPGEGGGGGRSCSSSGVGHHHHYQHHQHDDTHVMDHSMATMLRMIPCGSGASLRAPNVQTHIPMRGGGGDGGRVDPQDLATSQFHHHHHIRRPHGFHRLYHLHQRRHHQHQHQQQQAHQHCQAVDHRPPNPATLFDQEMRLFESQIAQTASRNINRQPSAPSPLFLPVQAAHVAERLVPPPPPLSLAADHEEEDDDDHHLQLQGASKSSGGASGGSKGVIEMLQGAGGSDVQQDTRIIISSSISKSSADDDHLPSSVSQIGSTQAEAEAEAEAAAVVPAPLEKVMINVNPAGGGSFGTGSACAGKKAVLPLSPVCELSEMMRLSSSNSSQQQQQQQQQQSCALPSPGASHDHKRKISEPIEDEVSTWIEPLRFLVRKGLTLSDCGELGRVVLPKKDAEAQLPRIDNKEGVLLTVTDYDTMKQWLFRYKWWLNNKSRMYVLENTGEFIKYHDLKENDAMLLYEDASGKLVIHGEKNLNRDPYHVLHQQACKSQDHTEGCKVILNVAAVAPANANATHVSANSRMMDNVNHICTSPIG